MIEVDAGQFAQYKRLFAARANTTPIIRGKMELMAYRVGLFGGATSHCRLRSHSLPHTTAHK